MSPKAAFYKANSVIYFKGDESDRVFDLGCFRRDDSQIAIGQFARFCCGLDGNMKIVASRDRQTFPIECTGMVIATNECPNFGYSRQVRRIKTSDCTAADNAYPLHLAPALRRLSYLHQLFLLSNFFRTQCTKNTIGIIE